MKIFVTGATGFIGSNFVRYATRCGHTVVAPFRPGRVRPVVQGINWFESDLDFLPVDCMLGCDALVHFAAAGVSPKKATQKELMFWNVDVTLKLIEMASLSKVKRIIIAGSSAEYGRSAELYKAIPPEAALLPTSSYPASKAACFVSSYAAALELGIELCYLRIFSAFGPSQFEGNLWPAIKKAALAGEDFAMTRGEQIRDFIEVAQVSKNFLFAVIRNDIEKTHPLVWNVASGRPVSVKEFTMYWWNHWEAKGKLRIGAISYRPGEVMRFVPMITEKIPETLPSY